MNWQEFEDRIGAESREHQVPVDTEALWEKIREKRRKRWPLFWLLLGGMGLLVMAGLWWNSHSVKSKNPVASKVETGLRTDLLAFQASPAAGKALVSPVTIVQLVPTGPTSPTTNKPPVFPGHSSPKLETYPATRTFLPSQPVKTTNPETLELQENSLNMAAADPILSKPRPENAVIDPANSAAAGSFTDLPGLTKPAALPFILHAFIPLRTTPPVRPRPAAFFAEATAADQSNAIYLGLQTGYYHWQIQRSAAIDTLYPRSGEKILSAWQVGLHTQLPLTNKWSLRAGILYTEYQSVFRWSKTWEVYDTATLELNYYVNGNIDTAFVAGWSRYEREVQHYNRLQSVAIPLDIQYRLPLGRFSLQPSMGLQLQFGQRAEGTMLRKTQPNTTSYDFIYRRTFNLGLRLGISLEAPLGPKTRLFMEPAAGFDLVRRTAKYYPAEHFRQWGLNVGILRRW